MSEFTRTSANIFALVVSLVYSFYWSAVFYPGILYTDSIKRWDRSIDVAQNGFGAILKYTADHPIIPTLLQSLFYKSTGELGFYIVVQAFFLPYGTYLLVSKFLNPHHSVLLFLVIIMIPLNTVFAVFHSFDSMFTIFLFGLCYGVATVKANSSLWHYFAICILLVLAISTRLNAILLVFPVALILSLQLFQRSRKKLSLVLVALFLAAMFPSLLLASLGIKSGGMWVKGISWEYASMAKYSANPKHNQFITEVGSDPNAVQAKICYHGIWCGTGYREFGRQVLGNKNYKTQLAKNYLELALTEPLLFGREKVKYVSSIMGISRDLSNPEISRVINEEWQDKINSYGFVISERKKEYISDYYSFSKKNQILFKPYFWFIISSISFLSYYLSGKRKLFFASTFFFLPWFYYFTFFITSQNHEMRYFYPTLYLILPFVLSTCVFQFPHVLNRLTILTRLVRQRVSS